MNAEDKIIQKLVEIDQKLDTFATKLELADFKDQMMTQLDKHSVILDRLDQERVFTIDRVKRIEDDVEKIKLELKLA